MISQFVYYSYTYNFLMNLSIREVFVNYYKISFCNEFDLSQLEFYMDVSPEWWINSSKNESIVRKYICEKFEYDCYPKINI